MKYVLSILLCVACFALAVREYGVWSGEAFGAFYCAGAAVGAGENPYTVEPLRTCEHRVWQTALIPPDAVEPAPLPGYALAPFVLLAKMPYHWANVFFATLSLVGIAASAYILAEISGLSLAVTLGALVVGGYINVFFGEIPPLAIFFLCLSAACVVSGRDRLAACACIAAMMEPHTALPAVLSLFIRRPRARPILLFGGAGCAALSALLLSPSVALSYVTSVLPIHARAEIDAADQYSLTWLAHTLGASDSAALLLGTGSYVALAIAGVILARRAADALGAPALIVLFPVAAATLFGSFIHDVQLPAAMPAALLIAAASSGAYRVVAWAPVCLLAVSWQPWWFGRIMTLFEAGALTTIVAFLPGKGNVLQRGARVLAMLLVFRVLMRGITRLPEVALFSPISSAWPRLRDISPHDSASLNWGAYTHGLFDAPGVTLELLLSKMLAWFALLVILGEGALAERIAARGTRGLSPRRETI